MKEITVERIFKGFGSFTEIVLFLKQMVKNRWVEYGGDVISSSVGVDGYKRVPLHNGKAVIDELVGVQQLVMAPEDLVLFSESKGKVSLSKYFDENNVPLDDAFAGDFDLSKMVGVEVPPFDGKRRCCELHVTNANVYSDMLRRDIRCELSDAFRNAMTLIDKRINKDVHEKDQKQHHDRCFRELFLNHETVEDGLRFQLFMALESDVDPEAEE